jgi:hypothetical protein
LRLIFFEHSSKGSIAIIIAEVGHRVVAAGSPLFIAKSLPPCTMPVGEELTMQQVRSALAIIRSSLSDKGREDFVFQTQMLAPVLPNMKVNRLAYTVVLAQHMRRCVQHAPTAKTSDRSCGAKKEPSPPAARTRKPLQKCKATATTGGGGARSKKQKLQKRASKAKAVNKPHAVVAMTAAPKAMTTAPKAAMTAAPMGMTAAPMAMASPPLRLRLRKRLRL